MNILERFMHFVSPEPMSGCWLWTGVLTAPNCYGRFTLNGAKRLAHHIAYELFKGNIPTSLLVLHSCDVRCCVNPAHLSLGTHSDNTRQAVARGRQYIPCGTNHHLNKLTEVQVREIRALRGVRPQRKLAAEFGVRQSTIKSIQLRHIWQHLT